MKNQSTIYIDMDGVIADFAGSAAKVHNFPIERAKTGQSIAESFGLTNKEFWSPIDDLGSSFWENLDEYPWTDELISLVEEYVGYNWYILSSPSHNPECLAGKMKWLQKKFGWDFRRFIFAPKNLKCKVATNTSILIDDDDGNYQRFEEARGLGILFPQPWNYNADKTENALEYTKQQLKDYFTNISESYYTVPSADKPCAQCKYSKYDSFHDELWCNHDNPPTNLGSHLIVDNWGTCENWESINAG